MRMRLLTTVAVPLFAVIACAQDYPQTNPGSSSDNSTDPWSQTGSANCSDPLMAGSSQCTGNQNGALRPGATQNGQQPSGAENPSSQQGRVTTYTDERGQTSTTRGRNSTNYLAPEPLTEFQKFTASTTGMVLPIFGANLFQNVPTTFSPLDNSPVPADYVIGPDDEVRVRVWGQVNFNANLRVDRSGDIFLPQVGAVHVAGIRFADMDQRLREAVGKIYRNFDLSAALGQIRAIQVYVTGEARRPGVYTVSSLSTLVDALFASGGPSVQGSMRRIELRRAGDVVVTFDLYRLLVNGDKSKDAKLLPGDVIFIPPVGLQAAVLGSVRRPAIYELLPGDTVAEAIKDAGSASSLASDARASLERSVEHTGRQAMEVRLDTAGLATPMQDGDILRIISLVSKYQKTVTLRGNTANPGRFAWHEGMRLSDLIPDRESLITRDYWWKRVSLGLPAPEFEPVPALSAMRQPTSPIDLPQQQPQGQRPGDGSDFGNAQQTTRTPSTQYPYNPSPSGSSNSPNYPYNPSYTGYPPDAGQYDQSYPANNTALYPNADNRNQQTGIPLQGQARAGMRGSQSALAEDDNEPQEPVNPKSARRTSVRLSVPEIDWSYAVIERMDPATLKATLVSFDLGKLVMQHDAVQDLELQPGDVVSVFSQSDIHVPIAEQTGFVRLEGEFVHAGTYSVRPGETLRSLVQRAGGMTPNAYLYGSVFSRESTRVIQQRRMDESIHTMILQMQRGNLALAASPASSAQDLAGVSATQSSERELIAQLEQIRATGRIVFAFKPDTTSIDSLPEVPLENGDTFLIPSVPSTIHAVGAVFNQNSFLYRPNTQLRFYLQMAGGPNSAADRRHMFIIRANGEVVSRGSVKSAWGDEFYHLKLSPGDTIVVPDKTIKPSAIRGLLDYTQIFSQLAIGAAAFTLLP